MTDYRESREQTGVKVGDFVPKVPDSADDLVPEAPKIDDPTDVTKLPGVGPGPFGVGPALGNPGIDTPVDITAGDVVSFVGLGGSKDKKKKKKAEQAFGGTDRVELPESVKPSEQKSSERDKETTNRRRNSRKSNQGKKTSFIRENALALGIGSVIAGVALSKVSGGK